MERGAAGTRGTLRVGYQVAATLGPWRLTLAARLPAAYRLEAAVDRTHGFWITQGPFEVALAIGPDTWAWANVRVDVESRQAVALLVGMPVVARGAAADLARDVA